MGSAEHLIRRRPGADDAAGAVSPLAATVLVIVAAACRCLLLTALALGAWSIVPALVGLPTATVMSGSMAPALQVGDAVVTRPLARADLVPGQVLLFDDPDHPDELRLHRLVHVDAGRLVTKGDANAEDDSSTTRFGAVHGAGFLRVPLAGLPVYWLRTHDLARLIGSAVALCALAAGSRLDRRFVLGRHVQRDVPRARHRRPRYRAAALGALLAVALGGSALAAAPRSADAGFASTTANGPDTLASGCWDWPVRGTLPAGAIAYFNYMEQSGTTTADRAHPGTSGTFFGTVGHTAGSCATNDSAYITLGAGGASGVVQPIASGIPPDVTIATWFRTTAASGTIADIGSNASGGASGSYDRALYVNASGGITFAAVSVNLSGVPLGIVTCQSPGGFANGQWHVVVATFSTATGCTVSVDGATPTGAAVNSSAVSIQVLAATTGYWRFGYDGSSVLLPGAGTTNVYRGDLDESQIYAAVLSAQQQATLVARGR